MARTPNPRPKRHPLAHMQRRMPDMDLFPDELWMLHYRGNYNEPAVKDENELPAWMSPTARQEVLETAGLDPDSNARWWTKLSQVYPAPRDPELLFIMAAMAARLGWPGLVQDLVNRGAPMVLEKPAEGWRWLGQVKGAPKKDRYCILDLCVWSMRGYTAVEPLHVSQVESLQVLADAGARVEDILPETVRELMKHEALAKWCIAHGLRANQLAERSDHPPTRGEIALDCLFMQFPKISENVHGRILSAFIEQGMPLRFNEEGPSIADRLAQTVAGLTQIFRLSLHPDRAGVIAAIHEAMPQIEKRLARRSEADQKAFRADFDLMMLELGTPQAQALRARARL